MSRHKVDIIKQWVGGWVDEVLVYQWPPEFTVTNNVLSLVKSSVFTLKNSEDTMASRWKIRTRTLSENEIKTKTFNLDFKDFSDKFKNSKPQLKHFFPLYGRWKTFHQLNSLWRNVVSSFSLSWRKIQTNLWSRKESLSVFFEDYCLLSSVGLKLWFRNFNIRSYFGI